MCEWGNVVTMKYPGRRSFDVDSCIAPIVKALNDGGIETIASCCGHRNEYGIISLTDGREFIVCPSWESARRTEELIQPIKYNEIEYPREASDPYNYFDGRDRG